MIKTHIQRMALFTSMAIFSFAVSPVLAQEKLITISGKVTSFEESFPLEGVSVAVKDTKLATGTMPDGNFSIDVRKEDRFLIFALPGYATETIELKPGHGTFYEVTMRRGDLSGAGSAAKISGEGEKKSSGVRRK